MKNNDFPKEWKYAKLHSQDLIFGDALKGMSIRSALQQAENCACISQIVPKKVDEALKMNTGSFPCKLNSTNLKEIKFGN